MQTAIKSKQTPRGWHKGPPSSNGTCAHSPAPCSSNYKTNDKSSIYATSLHLSPKCPHDCRGFLPCSWNSLMTSHWMTGARCQQCCKQMVLQQNPDYRKYQYLWQFVVYTCRIALKNTFEMYSLPVGASLIISSSRTSSTIIQRYLYVIEMHISCSLSDLCLKWCESSWSAALQTTRWHQNVHNAEARLFVCRVF